MGNKAIKNVIKNRPIAILLFLPAICTLILIATWSVGMKEIEVPYLTAKSIMVVNCENGKTLYEKDASTPRPPASITKLMTLLLVFEDLENGKIGWDDTFLVTPEQADTKGSKYGIKPGEELTVRQLVAGVSMASGCDCVQCLVSMCAEDEESFVRRMNKKADELDMQGTHFSNATGIDAIDQYMTAQDVARLSETLIETYPEILDFTSAPELDIDGRIFKNINVLVGEDERVLGLKTGTTAMSGYSLVTYAEKNGRHSLIVLLDSNNDWTRYAETQTILDAVYGANP